jgi:excisionase family DNA binding protein
MVSILADREPVAPPEGDQAALTAVVRLLDATDEQGPMLVGPPGSQVDLPASLARVLLLAARAMSNDRAVAVVPVHKQLTTQQAATMLGVSRPYLVKLLDEGEIPSTKTGTHRRVRLEDLMAYADRRDVERRKNLDLLTQISQELGLYEST